MWLDLAIALSCGGGGVVCGWIMHAIGGFGNQTFVKKAAASIAQPETDGEPNHERLSEVARQLKAQASSMAAHVDAHQSKVQIVNDKLIEGKDASPETAVEAIGQLIEANEVMQTRLREAHDRIHEQTLQIESAERRAQTDALTRVPNRRAFDSHIHQQHSLGAGRAGTLALLDVDHFKRFNDVYGHRAGDEVLRVVAKMLHTRLHDRGIVARFGGEEFAVILNGCPVDEAKEIIELARIAISERDIEFEDKRLRVSASAGVADLTQGASVEEWLQKADDAMYRSKAAGRNCGHWMDGDTPVRIVLSEDFQDAASRPQADSVSRGEPKDGGPQPGDPRQEFAARREEPPRNAQRRGDPQHDADTSVSSAQVAGTGPPARQADPSAFAYLPDRRTLGVAFDEIRDRTQSSVSIFVMAILCTPEAGTAPMRSLLQIVRATMRSVDRLGCDDGSTLLVCMPSIDEGTANERSMQIFRSVQAMGLGVKASGKHPVRVGVAQAGKSEEFAYVVSRAVQLAGQDREEGSEPVSVERRVASV